MRNASQLRNWLAFSILNSLCYLIRGYVIRNCLRQAYIKRLLFLRWIFYLVVVDEFCDEKTLNKLFKVFVRCFSYEASLLIWLNKRTDELQIFDFKS